MKPKRQLKFFKNKKGQYYLFTAVILIVYAMLILRPNVGLDNPNNKLEKMKQNFEIETVTVINNALISGENVTKELDLFTDEFVDYARLSNVDLELFYLIVIDEDKTAINKMDNYVEFVQINQTLEPAGSMNVNNDSIENFFAVNIEDDNEGTFRYLFNITNEPNQLKYVMRVKRGNNIQIIKNEI
ncbi:hypothetical protein HOK51_00925 [Candidatus Woesearchaeota archaeon]|jgi:hypothetical protein|nr:hypothetical protein [Candidatus Woesearchaeota archaeon]MBT6518378.1 hypothetical protein [Candidatus Woesearchaeota archaeon]MBT7368739.1 hypothetical protein [Candidatus Woesearchaeota archaeon]